MDGGELMGTLTDLFHFYKPAAHEGLTGSPYTTPLNNNWDKLEQQFEGSPFDIRTEGAACDGVTDDWDAIMATIEKTRYYAIGAGFGGATMPDVLQGSAGGGIYIPYGVTAISAPIKPDQRGGCSPTTYSANKAFSIIGPGFSSARLKAIGAGWAGKAMVELGTDGGGNASPNTDNEGGMVTGVRFDGGGVAATGVRLVECTNMAVDNNGFGGLTDYGILSEPDPLSGHDYGGIDLRISRNFFGWRSGIGGVGLANGIGIKCLDPHALTIEKNEFSDCRHGNVHLSGGGGNMFRLRDNTFEGMNLAAQTDAGGPYHSVYTSVNYGLIEGNTWEDVFTSAPDCRHLLIDSAGAITVTGNHCGVNPGDYSIEIIENAAAPQQIYIVDNPWLRGQVASISVKDLPPAAIGYGIVAWNNGNYTMEAAYANDPYRSIYHGPATNRRGFDRGIVGDWFDTNGVTTLATWDVRGSLRTSTYMDIPETTAPAAPPANTSRTFTRDNGSGKTQLCVLFPTGAVQVIATEP